MAMNVAVSTELKLIKFCVFCAFVLYVYVTGALMLIFSSNC